MMGAIRYLEEDVLDAPFYLVLTTGRGVVTTPLPDGEQSDIGRDRLALPTNFGVFD